MFLVPIFKNSVYFYLHFQNWTESFDYKTKRFPCDKEINVKFKEHPTEYNGSKGTLQLFGAIIERVLFNWLYRYWSKSGAPIQCKL